MSGISALSTYKYENFGSISGNTVSMNSTIGKYVQSYKLNFLRRVLVKNRIFFVLIGSAIT